MSRNIYEGPELVITKYVGPERKDHGPRATYQLTSLISSADLVLTSEGWEALAAWFAAGQPPAEED